MEEFLTNEIYQKPPFAIKCSWPLFRDDIKLNIGIETSCLEIKTECLENASFSTEFPHI